MEITLISRDKDLPRLCRDILTEVARQKWTLSVVEVDDVPLHSDLYLWDLPPTAIPSRFPSDNATHLSLISRKDLASVRQQPGRLNPNILLKPVTCATLTAFLTLAVNTHEHRQLDRTSLRADLDEILQCLIQTNLKLQEYDLDRTAFLARAVHDFRAPLTALSGYCGLLLSEPLGPLTRDQREVIQRMLNSTQRLSRIADAMFQLSVGRQIKRLPDLRPGEIQECLEQALHELAPFVDDKSITITLDATPCPRQLFFEPGQIEQVLINILHNACKFTPRRGTIEVIARPFFWERRIHSSAVTVERRRRITGEENSYRIDFRNSGSPIPAEHLNRIFEEYTSYGGGGDRSGGGLGLAISRMIVTQHEGKIWAENTTIGPMISFLIPMRKDPARRTEKTSMSDVTLAEVG
jgi:signal transduction histidine kinase